MNAVHTDRRTERPPVRRRRGCLGGLLLIILIAALAVGAYGLTDGFEKLYLPVRVDTSNIVTDFYLSYGQIEARLTGDMYTYSPSESDLAALRAVAEANPEQAEDIEFLIDHIGAYSQAAVNSVLLSPEKTDFVLRSPLWEQLGAGEGESVSVTKGEVPFFIQYDSRWAFEGYGSSCIGNTACGPTCLAMAAAGLTGDGRYTPDYLSGFAEENGYYVNGAGTSWGLFTQGAALLGLRGEELPGGRVPMIEALRDGGVVIASMLPGDFTMSGHFVVIYGWGLGGFKLYDPSGVERSGRTWAWSELEPQIAACWAIYE